ncbi:MAG: AEC family transporter [Methylococcales bacterium]|nr:AEC family transporter [Methylococcales bacterium]
MPELILQIVTILAPGMCLALIGLVWYHSGSHFPLAFVTTLVVNVCLPALLFHTLATAEISSISLGSMAKAALVVHLIFTPIAWLLLRIAGKDWRLCISHVVGNTGNLGLPVCYFAFGDEGLAYAMAFFAVQCLLLFSLGDAILAGSADIKRLMKSPILHAIWMGVAARMLDLQLPVFALESLQLLGQIVIPLMLITLGVSLAGMRASQWSSSLVWSLTRTVLAIAIGFGVAALFGMEGAARGVLVIETAVPVAVFNFLLAVKHGRNEEEVSGLILVTHLGSILYLPLVLGFLLAG